MITKLNVKFLKMIFLPSSPSLGELSGDSDTVIDLGVGVFGLSSK